MQNNLIDQWIILREGRWASRLSRKEAMWCEDLDLKDRWTNSIGDDGTLSLKEGLLECQT